MLPRDVASSDMTLPTLPPIHRLDLSVVTLPDTHPEASNQRTVPVYGYVIDHPDGAIVVDTGVGFGNPLIDEMYEPVRVRLDEALDRVGIDVSSIIGVVNSHLHFDHCGQNPLFHSNGVPIFVQQLELDQIDRDQFYTDAEWAVPPVEQQRVLDGDAEVAEGVTILATPGHTPGHQSVVIDAGSGRVVLAGQAVWALREFLDEEATASNAFSDEHRTAALESIRRIKALRPTEVHFAHCAAHLGRPRSPAR